VLLTIARRELFARGLADRLRFVIPPQERENPDLLAKTPSRRRRIARGSGRTEVDVSGLLQSFTGMRARMNQLSKMMRSQGGALSHSPRPPPWSLRTELRNVYILLHLLVKAGSRALLVRCYSVSFSQDSVNVAANADMQACRQ